MTCNQARHSRPRWHADHSVQDVQSTSILQAFHASVPEASDVQTFLAIRADRQRRTCRAQNLCKDASRAETLSVQGRHDVQTVPPEQSPPACRLSDGCTTSSRVDRWMPAVQDVLRSAGNSPRTGRADHRTRAPAETCPPAVQVPHRMQGRPAGGRPSASGRAVQRRASCSPAFRRHAPPGNAPGRNGRAPFSPRKIRVSHDKPMPKSQFFSQLFLFFLRCQFAFM